jgi:hypothetical protein
VKKQLSILLCAVLTFGAFPAPASAAINVERHGTENPMVEIFKSTVYGALAGLVVGGAIALAAQGDEDTTGNIFRWSIVGGTAVGLGAGIYFVSKRPQPSALLELNDGGLSLHPTAPQLEPGGGMSMRLVAVRF